MSKFKGKYRIESTRAQWWDYGNAGSYFITICTHDRNHYFGVIENAKMNLSRIGIIADLFWQEINNRRKNVELGEYVIMPNHIHGILKLNKNTNDIDKTGNVINDGNVLDTRHALYLSDLETIPISESETEPTKTPGQKRFRNPGKNTISSIIGSYKSAVTKHAHRMGLDFAWQSRFHDHIIRDQREYQRIEKYIIENPSKWLDDRFHI